MEVDRILDVSHSVDKDNGEVRDETMWPNFGHGSFDLPLQNCKLLVLIPILSRPVSLLSTTW